MGPWVPTYFLLQAMVDAMIGQDPSSGLDMPMQGVYAGLFLVGSPNPSNNTLLADLTEATYTGYVRQPVVWFPPYIDVLGPVGITSANMMFRPTDSAISNNVQGAFLATKITGGALLAAARFANPIVLINPTTAFTMSAVFQLANSSTYGRPLVFA